MLLNNNEYSLQTISDKTNITIENLEKLSNKEWEHFKKAQANGLISIIEREFKVDLSDLKAEANAYYQEHQGKEPDRTIDLVDAATVSGGGNRLVSNIITVITLCALGYAGWYYFVEQKEKTIIENNTTKESSGMFSNTIKSAKELLGNDGIVKNVVKSETTNVTKDLKEKKIENRVQEPVKSVAQEVNNSNVSNSTAQEKVENSPKKFDITTIQEANSSNTQTEALDNNKTKMQEEVVVAKAEATEDKKENSNNATIKSEVDQLLKELDENNSQKEQQVINEDNSSNEELNSEIATTVDENSSNIDENQTQAAITEATFNLKSKRLWIGIYNLTTGKKVSKFIKKPYKLDIGNDKFAIITGHNAFELSTDNGVKTFAKRGKVYFTISADGVEKLTKKEYRELTKKRAW